jgi:hypothetical protein
MHGTEEKYMQNFARLPKGRKPLRRQAYRWEDNIKIDVEEVEYVGVGAFFIVMWIIGGFL